MVQLNTVPDELSQAPSRTDGPDLGFVLGVDVGGTKVALASTAADGTRLLDRRIATRADEGAERVLARILEQAHAVVDETAASTGLALRAIGMVTPGVVREHGILLAPNNPGWEVLPLRARLAEAFPGVAIAVMNDVRAAAVAEATRGALVGADTAVFINLGTGLSAAILVGGEVLDGENGAAGEIAYQQPGTTPGRGYADGNAPLEELVSGQGIADRAGAVLGRPVTTREVFEAADGHPAMRAVVDEAFAALAVQVTNLAVALNPSRIVLGGGLVRHWEGLVPGLRAVVGRAAPFPPEVLASALDADAALEGALTIARRAADGHPADLRRQR